MGCIKSKQETNNTTNALKINDAVAKEKQKIFEKKVILIGDAGVGKSSIAQRFCRNKFEPGHNVTLGAAYLQQKVILTNGSSIKLHIWDTSGEERFRAMLGMYYKDASAAILTYDITKAESLESLNYWLTQLKDYEPIIIAIAGNKCDMENERKVQLKDGRNFAKTKDLIFQETSCKNNTGIYELFTSLAQKMYDEDLKKNKN